MILNSLQGIYIVQLQNLPNIVDTEKLKQIITSVLDLECTYTEFEVISKISQYTKVSEQRAKNGFNLMIKNKLIQTNQVNRYYLVK